MAVAWVIDRIKQESFMTENVCTPVTSAAKKLHAAGRATGVRVALGGQKPASIGGSGMVGKTREEQPAGRYMYFKEN